jgi:hypothetical protein
MSWVINQLTKGERTMGFSKNCLSELPRRAAGIDITSILYDIGATCQDGTAAIQIGVDSDFEFLIVGFFLENSPKIIILN